jgi:perosamine synthetase
MRERERVFSMYAEILENKWDKFDSNLQSNPWLATLQLPNKSKSIDQVREHLESKGIETRPGFTLFTEQPFLRKYISPRTTPISAVLSSRTLSLPTYPQLSNEEIVRVCDALMAAMQ